MKVNPAHTRTGLATSTLAVLLCSAVLWFACGDESGAIDEPDAIAVDSTGDGAGQGDTGGVPDAPAPDTSDDAQAQDSTTTDTAVADTTVADTTVADTTVADTTVADTTVADTTVADTTVTDTNTSCGAQGEACCSINVCNTGLLCVAGTCAPAPMCTPSCATPAPGQPDVPVNVLAGSPPPFTGGTLTDATYEMSRVDIYPDNAFSNLVSGVAISSNGNTYGSLSVTGQDWGLDSNFDLMISLDVFGTPIDQPVNQAAATGGCFEIRGNLLVTDLSQCVGGTWPGGVAPPGALPFESSATELKLDLTLSKDMLIASVPPDYQAIAGLAITGDLPLVMTFTKN